MAQANKPATEPAGPESPPLRETLRHYWNYLPFPLSWIIVVYLVLIILTWLVIVIAN